MNVILYSWVIIMLDNINLNLLKYFYEVVNEGNITRASENLMISQPAITKSIKELESELNVKLLERSKKGVIPTLEGKILYEHTKEILNQVNTTINIIESSKNTGGELYIGATTTNFMIFIKEALNQFKKKYPNIHIKIILDEINILNDMARLGKLDILIKNDYELFDDFSLIKSFEIQDRFIAAKKFFPELENKTYKLEELLEYPFVLLSDITHGRKNFNNYLKSKNINFKPTYEFNSYSLCRELIEDGFGIGIGNPIHYNNNDFIIIKTNFNLPIRKFNIGYITSSKNKFINIFKELIIK